MKTLLSDLLAAIAPEILPADSTQQIPWTNRVLERIFSIGKFKDTTIRWRGVQTAASFAVYNDANNSSFFTLPRGILCLLAGAAGTAAPNSGTYQARFSTRRIQGPWYEFGNTDTGVGDQFVGSGIGDAGDGWTTFRDITEASYLRCVTATTETNPSNILFQGLDQLQAEIYTGTGGTMYQGVKLNIGAALTTTTTQQFGAAPRIVQKPVTNGPVSLYAVSVATGVVTLIAIYDPGETSPGYRRYRLAEQIGTSGNVTTVQAMCKRRFVPVVANADEVIPGNISAIELGFQGRRYDLANDPKTAAVYWNDAISLLNSDLMEANGGASARLVWQYDTGLAKIPWI